MFGEESVEFDVVIVGIVVVDLSLKNTLMLGNEDVLLIWIFFIFSCS